MGKSIFKDDRTEDQKSTHWKGVKGTDTVLSGWGQAEGMTSYAIWACKPEDLDAVYEWVESRSDMKNVAEVDLDDFVKPTGHTHVYVVTEGHSSLCQSGASA